MILNRKIKYGQFYTSNAEIIIGNLIKYIPKNKNIIDPFSGNWDLLNLFCKKEPVIGYDIFPQNKNTIKQDTLLNPPIYTKDDWIITNPPYLAKNKNKDKKYYEKYDVNDLYKASIKSIEGCFGGIIILPIGFFTSNDGNFRKYFFQKYEIISDINIFEYQVFDDTTSSVCSFAFKKRDTQENKETFSFLFWEDENSVSNLKFELLEKYGYQIGGEIHNIKTSKSIKVSRLMDGQIPTTKMKLYCLDNKNNLILNNRIRLQMDDLYFGKNTDRMFATIQLNIELTEQEQEKVCEIFNAKIEDLRLKYRSLFLSSYREFTRKRITFKQAYTLINNIIYEIKQGE